MAAAVTEIANRAALALRLGLVSLAQFQEATYLLSPPYRDPLSGPLVAPFPVSVANDLARKVTRLHLIADSLQTSVGSVTVYMTAPHVQRSDVSEQMRETYILGISAMFLQAKAALKEE